MIGECRWRNKAMDGNVLKEIEEYKLPALHQAGYEVDVNLQILLFSRGGYGRAIERVATENAHVRPVDLSEVT